MLRLLTAELFKLYKNKTFKVLFIVSIFLGIFTMIMTSSVMEKILESSMQGMSQEETSQIMEQLSSSNEGQIITPGSMGMQIVAKDPLNPTTREVFHSAFGSGLIEVLLGIFIAAFMAKEYSDKTIKNALSYGKKRYEFYISKFIIMIIGIAIILLALTVIPTVGNAITNGWGETFKVSQIGDILRTYGATLITSASVASIMMIIAILVKSNGGTIGITIGIFTLFPMLISFLYGKNKVFDTIYELTPFYTNRVSMSIYATGEDIVKAVIIALITIIIFLCIGVHVFKKQDIN